MKNFFLTLFIAFVSVASGIGGTVMLGFTWNAPECTKEPKYIHWYHTDTIYMADGDSIISMYLRDHGFKMWTVMRYHDDSTQSQWLRTETMWKKLDNGKE